MVAANFFVFPFFFRYSLTLRSGTQPPFVELMSPLNVATPPSSLYLNFVNTVGYCVVAANAALAPSARIAPIANAASQWVCLIRSSSMSGGFERSSGRPGQLREQHEGEDRITRRAQ